MSEIEIVVYYDRNFPNAWIEPQYSISISSFFQQNGVAIVDASKLEDFMTASIDQRVAHRKIVMFSQDVVPSTICRETGSNTLIREYLDAGGNVVWIGDIPLFYIGTRGSTSPSQCIQA